MAMEKEKVFLGDQSPGMGGLIRAEVMSKLPGVEVTYFIQDADCPWKVTGAPLGIIRKPAWPDYWATATRNAWSPNTPKYQDESFRASVGAPFGLVYISGTSGKNTFNSEKENARIKELSTDMLLEEVKWARKVAELMGKQEGIKRADALIEQLQKEKMNVYRSTQFLAKEQGLSVPIDSMIELFRRDPVKLSERIPHAEYWVVSSIGQRETWDGNDLPKGAVLLPKGHALPLELAAKGFQVGYTGMSYRDDMLALRDKYVPELDVHLRRISFQWNFGPDNPLAVLEKYYVSKNLARETPKTVRVDAGIFEGINKYWMGRPTSVSWLILGGEIIPTYEDEDYNGNLTK